MYRIAARILKRDGYTGDIQSAINKWLADHSPVNPLPPLCPSKIDPAREAECVKCRDLSWVIRKHEDGTSELVPCDCDEIQRKAAAQRVMLENSGIPQTSRRYTFESFKRIAGTEESQEAAAILATGHAPFKILLLYGGVGNGKTHLLYAAATLAVQNGMRAKFAAFPDILAQARGNIGRDGGADRIIEEYKTCEFLALDEIKYKLDKGAPQNQWAVDVLEDIINYRYRYELHTMLTTNHTLSTLPTQVASRLSEPRLCRCVVNSAPDYRRKVK